MSTQRPAPHGLTQVAGLPIGDEALAAELGKRFRKEVVEGGSPAFVAAKLAERDVRLQNVRVLDRALRDQFGYRHLLWVYSGRRGIHLWISDREAMALTDEQRRALVGWMTVVQGGKDMVKKVNVRRTPTGPLPPALK